MLNRIKTLVGRRFPQIVRTVHRENLSYLGLRALAELHGCVSELEKRGIDGALVEAGCALGGSAIVMASAKTPVRRLYVFDVFDMIPAPSVRDGDDIQKRYDVIRSGQSTGIGGDKYYGYEDDLLSKVKANFQRHGVPVDSSNVELVKGLFEDTLHLNQPVALAHLDGDWYESIKTCLIRLTPQLVVGGTLVIDDYEAWSGCRTAVDEFFAGKRGDFEFAQKSRLHIVRKRLSLDS
jgi:asparagine synthase (glutamine-hydrolysing)